MDCVVWCLPRLRLRVRRAGGALALGDCAEVGLEGRGFEERGSEDRSSNARGSEDRGSEARGSEDRWPEDWGSGDWGSFAFFTVLLALLTCDEDFGDITGDTEEAPTASASLFCSPLPLGELTCFTTLAGTPVDSTF